MTREWIEVFTDWYAFFGLSIPNKCIEVVIKNTQLKSKLAWSNK